MDGTAPWHRLIRAKKPHRARDESCSGHRLSPYALPRYGGKYVLATAAYNAGPNRARIWRAAVRNSMEAAASSKQFPILKHGSMSKNVLANMHTYAMLTGELDGRFAKLLGRVEPGRSKAADLP